MRLWLTLATARFFCITS